MILGALLIILLILTTRKMLLLEKQIRQYQRLSKPKPDNQAHQHKLIKEYAERLKIQHEVDQAILTSQSPRDIAKAALAHISMLIPCDWSSLSTFDPDISSAQVLAVQLNAPNKPPQAGRILTVSPKSKQIRALLAGENYCQPDLSQDQLDNDLVPQLILSETRSFVSIPLISFERLIGALNFGKSSACAFSEQQIAIGREIADSLTVAIQQAQLYQLESNQRRRLARSNALITALSQVTANIENITDPDIVMHTLGRELVNIGYHCYIALYTPDHKELRIRYLSSLEQLDSHINRLLRSHVIGWQFPRDFFSNLTTVLENRRPEYIANADQLAQRIVMDLNPKIARRIVTALQAKPGTPAIILPLSTAEQAQGIVVIWGADLQPDDLPSLTIFANQIAIVLQNAALFEAEAKRRQESELLRNALAELLSNLNQEQILDRILYHLEAVVPYDHACLFLLKNDLLQAVAGRGHKNLDQVIGRSYPAAQDALFQQVRTECRPLILEDANSCQQYHGWANTQAVRGWLCTPLIARARVIGCLTLDSLQVNAYGSQHAEQAQTFANYAAVALENARLYAEARLRADQLNALHATLTEISAELELPKLLQAILARAVELLNTTGGDLGLYQPESEEMLIVASHNMGRDYTGTKMKIGEGAMGQVARTCQPVIVDDYAKWIGKSEQYLNGTWKAVMAAPLLAGETLIGTIGIVDVIPTRTFSATDMSTLELFAQQAAIAVKNARAYAEAKRLSITDELTGISNRRHLFEIGRLEVRRAQRFKRPLSAILFDIDHFKQINDNYGHQAGDEVLRMVCQRIVQELRDTDIFGRYGGEEFVILLPETRLQDACQVANRIAELIAKPLFSTQDGSFEITISLGVTELPEHPITLNKLLEQADKAMYAAKNAGRNRLEIFQES